MPTCLQCSNTFPNSTVVKNRKVNLQRRKYCLDCSPFGQHNTRKVHLLIPGYRKCTQCNQIKEEINKNFYERKDGKYHSFCRQCFNQMSANSQRERKRWAVEYKGGKCGTCGYNKCLAALEFHHLDPTKKDFQPAKLFSQNKALSVIQKELDKCVLLCANCHREVHDEIKTRNKK